jgi:glutamyl-tRNA synthetase
MAESAEYYFRRKDPDPKTAEKFLTPEMAPLFEDIAREFADLSDFTPVAMEPVLLHAAENKGVKLGKVAQPVRVALTGGTVSPGIFEVMDVLGRDEVVQRLLHASRTIRGG